MARNKKQLTRLLDDVPIGSGDRIAIFWGSGDRERLQSIRVVDYITPGGEIVTKDGNRYLGTGRRDNSYSRVALATTADEAIIEERNRATRESSRVIETREAHAKSLNALLPDGLALLTANNGEGWAIDGLTDEQVKVCAAALKGGA